MHSKDHNRVFYFPVSDTVSVGLSQTSKPSISNHIDGPMLNTLDSSCYWLTYWERLLVFIGKEDAVSLNNKHSVIKYPIPDFSVNDSGIVILSTSHHTATPCEINPPGDIFCG